MTQLSLTDPAGVALRSLADHPARATASGISNGPYVVTAFGPAMVHDGLVELASHGLAVEKLGRWRLTGRGKKLARPSRR